MQGQDILARAACECGVRQTSHTIPRWPRIHCILCNFDFIAAEEFVLSCSSHSRTVLKHRQQLYR